MDLCCKCVPVGSRAGVHDMEPRVQFFMSPHSASQKRSTETLLFLCHLLGDSYLPQWIQEMPGERLLKEIICTLGSYPTEGGCGDSAGCVPSGQTESQGWLMGRGVTTCVPAGLRLGGHLPVVPTGWGAPM